MLSTPPIWINMNHLIYLTFQLIMTGKYIHLIKPNVSLVCKSYLVGQLLIQFNN